jgi:hypothetical protein
MRNRSDVPAVFGSMTQRTVNLATPQEAEAARRANEDLFKRMGAHAMEIARSVTEHELVVHFDHEPLPRMPARVRAPGGVDVRGRAKRSPS